LQTYEGHQTLFIYGDPAYHHAAGVLRPFTGRNVTREQRAFNAAMATARIAVENGFGKVSTLWQTNQFSSKLQSLNSPVAAYYMVTVLLTNIHTCIRGVMTPFGLRPPHLDEYLDLQQGTSSPFRFFFGFSTPEPWRRLGPPPPSGD
jgi:hypothetical protein